MREQAYVTRKTFHRHTESAADEVRRIWTRWTNAGVRACRYCGAPIVTHDRIECERTQARVHAEANP